jgi:YihY family inner membrane protein
MASAASTVRRTPATAKRGFAGKVDLFQQRHAVLAFPMAVIRKFSDDRGGQGAALIAYYGFFSIFPAMLVFVTVLGFVLEGNDELRQDIADSALAQFPIIGDTIQSSVANPLTGSGVALVVGLATALWAGLGMMQAVQDAMNTVWNVERIEQPRFLAKRVRSLLMLILIGVLLIGSTVLAQLTTLAVSGEAAKVLLFCLTVGWSIGIFMVAFRLLTAEDVSWGDVFAGACVAAVAYTALQLFGGLYIERVLDGASATYGTFAVVIGLLTWILLVATVTVLSAEVNVVEKRGLWPRSMFLVPATDSDPPPP